MPKAIPLRTDTSAQDLRVLARSVHDAQQARRLLALAGICDGLSRTEAARLGAMDAQTLRDWVITFNAEGPDVWSIRRHRVGPPSSVRNRNKKSLNGLMPGRIRNATAWCGGAESISD